MTSFVLPAMCFLALASCIFALTGHDWVFQSNPHTPRSILVSKDGHPIRHLVEDAFTYCFFVKIESETLVGLPKTVSLVSYSSEETKQSNEILLEIEYNPNDGNGESYSSFYVGGKGVPLQIVPDLNRWTHLCFSWGAKTGKVRMFLDGEQVCCHDGCHAGHVIGGGGILSIGQDQDKYDGGYDPNTGLQGRLTMFNMWSWELNKREVKRAYHCKFTGDIVDWNNSSWELHENMMLQPSEAPCSINTCPSYI